MRTGGREEGGWGETPVPLGINFWIYEGVYLV
jgi:hypothetical protein